VNRFLALVLCVAALSGCGSRVTRVVDGHSVEGRQISPQAYALYLAARLAEERGELDLALCRYAEVLEEDPDATEAWIRQGSLECRRNPDQGIRSLERAEELDPNHPQVFAARAECARQRGDKMAALQFAQRSFELGPTDLEMTGHLARALFDLERQALAEAVLLGWLHRSPGDPRVFELWASLSPDSKMLRQLVLAGSGSTQVRERLRGPLAESTTNSPMLATLQQRGLSLALDDALARGDRDLVLSLARQQRLPLLELVARARSRGAFELELELGLIALWLAPNRVPLFLRTLEVAARLGNREAEAELLGRFPSPEQALTSEDRALLRRLLELRVGAEAARLVD